MGLMDAYGPQAPMTTQAPKKSLWDMLSDPENKPVIAQALMDFGTGLLQSASAEGYKPGLMDGLSSGISYATGSAHKRKMYGNIANAKTPEEFMKYAGNANDPEMMKAIVSARATGMFKNERTPQQQNYEYIQSLPPEQQAAAMSAFFPQGMKNGVTIDPDTGALTVNSPNDSQGPYDPAPLAEKMGVPASQLDRRGLSGKDASMYAKQTRLAAEKRLGDEDYTAAASQARTNKQFATQFEGLMDKQETGGLLAIPGATTVAGWFDPEIRSMKAIQDKLTPQQREPGSGSTSNFDAQMFANSLPGPDKPTETNRAMLAANKLRADDTLQYQTFMSDYLAANGHLNGADGAWQKYLDENPIFDPSSPDKPRLNPARVSYQDYFGGRGAAQTEASAAPLAPPTIGEVIDGYRFLGGDPANPNSYQKAQ